MGAVIVVGCDPGFANLGCCRVSFRTLGAPVIEVVRTVVTPPDEDPEDRLQTLAVALAELGKADLYVTENQAAPAEGARKAGKKSHANAIYVREAQGLFRMLAFSYTGKQPVVITPGKLRHELGLEPSADKKALQQRAREIYGIQIPKRISEHAADSLVLAAVGAHLSGLHVLLPVV